MTEFVVGDTVRLTRDGQQFMSLRHLMSNTKHLVGEVMDTTGVIINVKGFLSNPNEAVKFFPHMLERIDPILPTGTPIETARTLYIFGMDEVPAGTKGVISHWTGTDYNVILVGKGMALLPKSKFKVDEASVPKEEEKPVVVVSPLEVRIGDVLKDGSGEEFVVDTIYAEDWEEKGVQVRGHKSGNTRTYRIFSAGVAVTRAKVIDVWRRESE